MRGLQDTSGYRQDVDPRENRLAQFLRRIISDMLSCKDHAPITLSLLIIRQIIKFLPLQPTQAIRQRGKQAGRLILPAYPKDILCPYLR